MAGVLGIPPRYCHDLIANALPRRPQRNLPKESPTSRGEKKCGLPTVARHPKVKQPLKPSPPRSAIGYLAVDGQYYPTKEKATRVTRAIEERERFMRWMDCKEKNRLDRLKRAAKSGDVTFTKYGVFETKRCPECDVYHRVPSVCSMNEPCPCSTLATYPLRKKLPSTSATMKSKSKTPKKVLPDVATQTSTRQLPEVATQTSRSLLPNLGSRTSCMKPSDRSSRLPAERRKLRFKVVTQCLVEDPSDCSTCESYDSKQSSERSTPVMEPECIPASCLKRMEEKRADLRRAVALKYREELEKEKVVEESPSECSTCESAPTESSDCSSCQDEKERDSEHLAQEKMVIAEEEALKERLEKEKKRYHASCKKLREMRCEKAEEEKQVDKDLDEAKLNLAHALKRKMAIKAMLSLLNQNHERIKYAVEKEKAAQRVAEEQRKLNELLAEQMQLREERMKKSAQGDKGSFQLPGQTDKNLSTTSQPSLSRLSSFNFSKMLYSVMPASENAHTREEVRGSPALMRNILDSLPDNPVSVSHSSAKMDPESIAAAKARKQARMEVRQGIIVLDKITQKLAKMMGYSILPTQKVEEPQVASKSVVEKLPPITRTQHPVNMTTAPVEWSNERSSMSNQKPEEKAEPTEPVKAKTVSEAAAPKQCTQCGAPGGGTVMKLTAAEHRAIRRAKIQAKIAELEKAKNAELQKLQEIETSESIELESPQLDKEATAREQVDESTEEVVSAEAEEAEDIKAGEADIAESEKEARIAVEKKMKLAKYEAARIAEIERAKNEMEKMAEPKQLKMEEEEKGSDELEHPEVAEVNVSGGDAVLEGEATIAKERETALAEYDSIIKSSTDHRIAQLEQAKMEREAARIAALDPAEREKEIARMTELRQAVIKKDASVEDGLQKPEETEIDESKERAELERQARIAQERKTNLAEYEQVINTVTEWRIAQLEQAKKDLEADRIAKLDPVEREKETARLAEMRQTKKENEADEFESIEGAENDESAGEDELLAERELTASEEELAESFVEPKVSHPRPPTPPPQHAAALHSHTSLFGPQTSLRTITEGGTCDFTPEFASPLTTHSFHAIVPYQSFRTRFGLRNHETMSDRQLGEEMRKLSHATMMVQNEILKRKRSKDTAIDPTIDSTTDETSGTQRKVSITLPVAESAENTEVEAHENVFAEEDEEELEWSANETNSQEEDTVSQATTDVTASLAEEVDATASSDRPDSVAVSLNEEPENPEPASAENASAEALKEKASNDSVNSLTVEVSEPLEEDNAQVAAAVNEESVETEEQVDMSTENQSVADVDEIVGEMAADVSASQTREDTPPPEPRKSSAASLKKEGSDLSQCSVQTWYSAQSLEEEYARNLQSAYSDATPAKSDSKASIVSLAGSKSSLKQETSESAVVEVQKKSNKCSIADKKSETSLKFGSGSTASFKDATTKGTPQNVTAEKCSQCNSDNVEAEQECSCGIDLSTVASEASIEDYMIALKSISRSSIKSKVCNASVKSKSGSQTSLTQESASLEEAPLPDMAAADVCSEDSPAGTTKSSSKSSVKSKSSNISVKSKSGSRSSLKGVAPQVESQPEAVDAKNIDFARKPSPPETPRSSSISSIRSRRLSRVSLRDASATVGWLPPANTEKVETSKDSSASLRSYAEAVKCAARSSSKSSVKSNASKTSVKSKSASQASLESESQIQSQPYSEESPATDFSIQDSTGGTARSASKSSVKSKTSNASVKSSSGSQTSLKSESQIPSQSDSEESPATDFSSQESPADTAKSASKSPVKSGNASVKSKSGSQASLNAQVTSLPEATVIEDTSDASKDSAAGTTKSASKSSVKSNASVKPKSGSQTSLKSESQIPDVEEPLATDFVSEESPAGTAKSVSKSSVKSKASNSSVKSKSGSQASLKVQVTSLPKAVVSEDTRKDSPAGTSKSASRSSVKSGNASVKSKSGSQASLKSGVPAEVETQTNAAESPVVDNGSEDPPAGLAKSSSKASVKSKASNLSVKSKSGSKASLKIEAIPSPEDGPQPEAIVSPAETQRSSSKSSIKSRTSKTSVKSKSGSRASLNTSCSPQVVQPETQVAENSNVVGIDAQAKTEKSATKSSLKSNSGSQTSLKSESSNASPKVESQPESEGSETAAVSIMITQGTPKSSSKGSVQSKASNTSVKLSSVPEPSPESASERPQEAVSQSEPKDTDVDGANSTTGMAKSSSKSSIKSKASKSSVKSKSGSRTSLKDKNETAPKVVVSQRESNEEPLKVTPKSSSKFSVKSSTSNTSGKCKSGSRASLRITYEQMMSAAAKAEDTATKDAGTPKSTSKPSLKSKTSNTSVRSKSGSRASLKGEIKEVKSQSAATEVPVVDNSNRDATSGAPKIYSVSSVKSKASNTSVKSNTGSQASLKNATSTVPNVVSQSEVHESNEDDVNGKADSAGIPRSTSRSSRASQPSLRLIMKAMSDVAPKESTPVIKKSLSKLSTSSTPRDSSAKQETVSSPSNASVKVSGSPNRSSVSLKSLRNSMKSMILPSMGSKANVDTAKRTQGSAVNIENKGSNASVTKRGSQADVTSTQAEEN